MIRTLCLGGLFMIATFSGCIKATDMQTDAVEGAPEGLAYAVEPRIHQWSGEFVGAGICRDNVSIFAGDFTVGRTLRIPVNSTGMVLELQWGEAPLDGCIVAVDPAGEAKSYSRDATDALAAYIRAEIEAPPIGEWIFMVMSSGPSTINYDVAVTVFFDEIPSEYTALE